MKPSNQNGFTLVELLVALAVGTIVIAGAYGSYDIVTKQYEKIEDVSAMHTASRSILRMLKRDIQMAGFEWRNSSGVKPFATISGAFTVVDSKNACCDKITVIYDEENRVTRKTVRVKITYSVAAYNDRKRLYRQRDIILPTASARTGTKAVLADYIEDLQFTNPDSSNTGGYVKLDNNGKSLADSATKWSCVKDNKTGLIWEVKTKSDLHNTADKYTVRYRNIRGILYGSKSCFGYKSGIPTFCSTTAYAGRVNTEVLCGIKSWKLPSKTQLSGLIDSNRSSPAIDTNFFPNTKATLGYYATPGRDLVGFFGTGKITFGFTHRSSFVRLVSTGGFGQMVAIDLVLRSRYKYEPERLYTKKSYTGGNYNIRVTDAYKRAEYSILAMVRNN